MEFSFNDIYMKNIDFSEKYDIFDVKHTKRFNRQISK